MNENIFPYTILFVEDEVPMRQNYVVYLKMLFRDVYEAGDGKEALRIYQEKKPDIMIVDINLPKLNGIEFLKRYAKMTMQQKQLCSPPTVKNSMLREAVGLKLTQYLIKPITRKALQESLSLAIEELSRFRITPLKKRVIFQNYSWDGEYKELLYGENSVELTNKERLFLALLFSYPKRIFTYDEIFEHVWGYENEWTMDGLKSLVKNIRKKVPKEAIKNIFAIGYKADI